ncbi:MAG: GNAT family N-acetyltransferase [Terriglobia bacterium]
MTRAETTRKNSVNAGSAAVSNVQIHPLTPARWRDLEVLFGERGACGGCWCMFWRQTRSEYEKKKGAGNKRAFKRLVQSGPPPGLLAYAGGKPVAWCAVAPREAYATLDRTRVLARVDGEPTWSVTCFFVAKPFRRQGITVQLLKAAAEFARKKGARIVEGYPVEPKKGRMPDVFAYTGLPSAYLKAGFVEVLRRSETRPIMRYFVAGKPARRTRS